MNFDQKTGKSREKVGILRTLISAFSRLSLGVFPPIDWSPPIYIVFKMPLTSPTVCAHVHTPPTHRALRKSIGSKDR